MQSQCTSAAPASVASWPARVLCRCARSQALLALSVHSLDFAASPLEARRSDRIAAGFPVEPTARLMTAAIRFTKSSRILRKASSARPAGCPFVFFPFFPPPP